MPGPTTRQELVDQLCQAYQKLANELLGSDASLAELVCVDDWTVKDVLAVRRWWTEQVVRWVKTGLSGKQPVTPKAGYRWSETPRLNADIVAESQSQSWRQVTSGLKRGYERVWQLIEQLDDEQLLGIGIFYWADKWPVARWISINTTRQYTTARTLIRKAQRAAGDAGRSKSGKG